MTLRHGELLRRYCTQPCSALFRRKQSHEGRNPGGSPLTPPPTTTTTHSQVQQVRETRDAIFTPGGGGPTSLAPSLARGRLRAMILDLAGQPPQLSPDADSNSNVAAAAAGGASGSGSSGGGGQRSVELLEADKEVTEVKIEIIDGIWAPTLLLPRESKAFVTITGMAAASVSAVVDAAGGSGDYTGAGCVRCV